jgi:hypothetical protein
MTQHTTGLETEEHTMARETDLSTLPVPADEITDDLVRAHGKIAAAMTSEAGRQVIRLDLYHRLLNGTFDTAVVIAMAQGGNAEADQALRMYAAQLIDAGCASELEGQVQIAAYTVKSLLRPAQRSHQRGDSRVVDNFIRDIGLRVLVEYAAMRWGLQETRGHGSDRPSASYFVALALKKKGIRLKEQQIARVYKTRDLVAARLAEYFGRAAAAGEAITGAF